MKNTDLITSSTASDNVLKTIRQLREKKGKEKEVLGLVEKSISLRRDNIIELLWEKTLLFQHQLMNEDFKGEGKDLLKRKVALSNMKLSVGEAEFLINRYKLKKWTSRLFRFKGRIADYSKDFKVAINFYKKAIASVKNDPEYIEKKLPRQLELKAFLSYSHLMTGNFKEGLNLARKTYRDFESLQEGKLLKRSDYTTWVIWRTGIPLRTINALIDKKTSFDKQLMKEWLNAVESDLQPPKSTKTWADFEFRMNELKALRKKLV
jgi:tetratricopeptide (TPR) repeat protein